MGLKDRKRKAQTKAITKAKASKRIENWMSLMQKMDGRMPRNIEDIYDTLIANGKSLESFSTYVQEAYKAKKKARRKRPS